MSTNSLTPGLLEPGKLVTSEQLNVQLGKKDFRSLKKLLSEIGVKGKKIGDRYWYSTTLICQALERDILNEQGVE